MLKELTHQTCDLSNEEAKRAGAIYYYNTVAGSHSLMSLRMIGRSDPRRFFCTQFQQYLMPSGERAIVRGDIRIAICVT